MNLALHTFRKDVRHLWPALLVWLALLGVLTNTDRWRSDTIISPVEGWLNLLVPLAWACLVALAVLEEPLAGDRHFWLTRPYRWSALLGAKAAFAILFLHVPSLLADAYVLAARGFAPAEWLPQLLWKQLTFAAFLTLPAMALSALLPGFTHFMLATFGIAAVAAFAFGAASREAYFMQRPDDYLRGEVTGLLVAVAALAIIWLQYRRRRAVLGRTVGIVVALLAGALTGLVPGSADYRARAMLHAAPGPVSLQLRPQVPWPGAVFWPQRTGCVIPVTLKGIPAGAEYRIATLSLTVTTSDGRRFESTTVTPRNQFDKIQLDARILQNPYMGPFVLSPLWLNLTFDPAVYQAVKDGNVRITGQTVVSLVRTGESSWMPVGGRVAARGVGHCSNAITDDRFGTSRIKVLCESPAGIPPVVRVSAWTPQDGRRYYSRLGDYGNPTSGPQMAWLSPLDRSKTFFNLSDPQYRTHPGPEVPMEYLDHARIAVTPEYVTGYSVADFDFANVSLSQFRLPAR